MGLNILKNWPNAIGKKGGLRKRPKLELKVTSNHKTGGKAESTTRNTKIGSKKENEKKKVKMNRYVDSNAGKQEHEKEGPTRKVSGCDRVLTSPRPHAWECGKLSCICYIW